MLFQVQNKFQVFPGFPGRMATLSDLWQQLESTFELEFDLQDTVEWGKKWLVDFNAGKTRLVSLDRSNNTGSIDVKMDGYVLEEKHLLRCWS